MSRILLADDSPHAQRMGERILREEGFEVVTVTDGETALLRLADVAPDVILVDAFLPSRSGVEICRLIKSDPQYKFTRVVLTAGLLEGFDEEEARAAGCDAVLRKPFEASVVVNTLKPLVEAARFARGLFGEPPAPPPPEAVGEAPESTAVSLLTGFSHGPPIRPRAEHDAPVGAPLAPPEIDAERVRAAITLALDRALPALIEEISERVLVALGH